MQDDFNLQRQLREMGDGSKREAPLLFAELPLGGQYPIVRSANGLLVAAAPDSTPVIFGFTNPDILEQPAPRIVEQTKILSATQKGLNDILQQEAELLEFIRRFGAIIDVHAQLVTHPITEVFLGYSPGTYVRPDGGLQQNHGAASSTSILHGFTIDTLVSTFRQRQHQVVITELQKKMRAAQQPKRGWW